MRKSTQNSSLYSEHCIRTYPFSTNPVSRTILERKHALSRLKPETPHSEVLSCHHDWADKLHAAILNYMRDANTALIARILKLPRELRDAIYMYLWDFEPDNDPNAALLEHWGAFDDAWFYKSEDVSLSLIHI